MAARLATPREMHRLAAERMVQLNPAFGLTGRTNVGRPESQTTGCSHLGPYYRFYAKATQQHGAADDVRKFRTENSLPSNAALSRRDSLLLSHRQWLSFVATPPY